MFELIVRMTNLDKDVEILKYDHINNIFTEKKMSIKVFMEGLKALYPTASYRDIKPMSLPKGCIGFNSNGSDQVYIINQPEHQRYVTYSHMGDNKAYKINYPNSIYVVYVSAKKIKTITHYMYDEWNEMETDLYYPAMPNSSLNICLGNARTEIENNNVIAALENIIYAPYSHATVNNAKSFKSTPKYFEWLSKNHMNKKYLTKMDKKLKDIYGGNL